MLDLHKPVCRRAVSSGRFKRRIIVTLRPGDVLEFREERCRKSFQISITLAYQLAVKLTVAQEKAKKRSQLKG